MFEEVLSKNAKRSLELLAKSGILKNAYLAGGTALALQFGHRYSCDFDFFTFQKFNEEIMVQRIAKALPSFKLEKKSWGTILGYIKDTRFSLFFYGYPLLFKTYQFKGVAISDSRDIAAMKISAIACRGTKRDFIDLYFVLEKAKVLTLEKALKLYDKKFKALRQNKMHILKSLVYFEDAEKDELPRMIKSVSWQSVKDFFICEQKKIVQKILL